MENVEKNVRKSSFRVCAIMSVFNEADIISESLSALIGQGIDVYVLDNMSTDNSLQIARDYLGRGVIGIESIRFSEDGREVFSLSGILKRKQELSIELDYDWYINVDADEIRYSPWPGVSLKEGISMVDVKGFNLINFKLFNFRMHKGSTCNYGMELGLKFYSPAESFNSRQVRAWKASSAIDIVSSGGHFSIQPNFKIYPIRFILKHYPVRSIEQGIRKINSERKNRFSPSELARNWHRQYDELSIDEKKMLDQLYWKLDDLSEFDMNVECHNLQIEATAIKDFAFGLESFVGVRRDFNIWKEWINPEHTLDDDEVRLLCAIFMELIEVREARLMLEIINNMPDQYLDIIGKCLKKESALQFLEGRPGLAEAVLLVLK